MSEHEEQVAFFQECAWRANSDWRWDNIFAIPNAGKRSFGALNWLYREGLRPGVLDICVPIKCSSYPGLFIEMKFGKNKLSKAQLEWKSKLERAGYKVAVCYSAKEAISVVEEYFK